MRGFNEVKLGCSEGSTAIRQLRKARRGPIPDKANIALLKSTYSRTYLYLGISRLSELGIGKPSTGISLSLPNNTTTIVPS